MSNESFVMVSLKDEESKKLAEIISNKTARKILDTLTKKEYTESDLAKELGIPLATIHYNLQHLVKAKLVTIDEFHYSSKGKEVNHYKLANKLVIITPASASPNIMEKLRKLLPITLLVGASAALLKIIGIMNGTSALNAAPLAMQSGIMEDSTRMVAEKSVEEAADTMMAETAQYLVANETGVESFSASAPAPETLTEPLRPFTYLPRTEYLFWLLLGVFITLLILMFVEYIKSKKR